MRIMSEREIKHETHQMLGQTAEDKAKVCGEKIYLDGILWVVFDWRNFRASTLFSTTLDRTRCTPSLRMHPATVNTLCSVAEWDQHTQFHVKDDREV